MKHYEDLIGRLRNATRLPLLQALCNEAADEIARLSKYEAAFENIEAAMDNNFRMEYAKPIAALTSKPTVQVVENDCFDRYIESLKVMPHDPEQIIEERKGVINNSKT